MYEEYVTKYAKKLHSWRRGKKIFNIATCIIVLAHLIPCHFAQAFLLCLFAALINSSITNMTDTYEMFHASAEQDVAFENAMKAESEEEKQKTLVIYHAKRARHDELRKRFS